MNVTESLGKQITETAYLTEVKETLHVKKEFNLLNDYEISTKKI